MADYFPLNYLLLPNYLCFFLLSRFVTMCRCIYIYRRIFIESPGLNRDFFLKIYNGRKKKHKDVVGKSSIFQQMRFLSLSWRLKITILTIYY